MNIFLMKIKMYDKVIKEILILIIYHQMFIIKDLLLNN